MIRVPFLFFSLLLLIPAPALFCLETAPAAGDSTLLQIWGDTAFETPWERSRPTRSGSGIDTAAALFGAYGIRVVNGLYPGWVSRANFRDSFVLRFYFRQAPRSADGAFFTGRAGFLSLALTNALQARQPKSFLWFGLARTGQGAPIRFFVQLSTSLKHRSDTLVSVPIEPGRVYCSETRVRFGVRDTVAVTQWLNNRDSATLVRHYPFAREFIEAGIENYSAVPNAPEIHLDGFALSDRRLYALAKRPAGCRETLVRDTNWLECDSGSPGYGGEAVVETEWRLDDPRLPGDFPLFSANLTDPAQLFRVPVPFPLDTGRYDWRVRLQNSFGSWGDWSAPRTLRVDSTRAMALCLAGVRLFPEKGRDSLLTLLPGRNYRMEVRFTDQSHLSDFGFLLGQLTHESYRLANPGNKGGPFLPDVNYPLHVTWRPPDSLVFIERQKNSLRARYVADRMSGVYLFPAQGGTAFDTAGRSLSVGFRLQDSARAGVWFMTVSVWYGADRLSNILRIPVEVIPEQPREGASPLRIGLGLAVVCVLIVVLVLRRRKRAARTAEVSAVSPSDADLERLREYLRRNLIKKITTADICRDLRWPERKFYDICRRNGIASLPRLLNQIRVETAKTLLKTTDKNVSEVAYEVGFSEPKYFIQVFREMEGVTPGDFREKA